MALFSCRGFTAATAGGAGDVITQLWNTDANQDLILWECGIFDTSNVAGRPLFVRTTARGTVGSTVVPDADNAWDQDDTPACGEVDLAAFSVMPTRAGAPELWGWNVKIAGAQVGSEGYGFQWATPYGIRVKPGSGVCVQQVNNNIWGASEVYWAWEVV